MRKCVLITGGARGLGSSIAREFAKNGHDIIFTYYNSGESAIKIKSDLEKKYGVTVDAIKVDLENVEEIENLISKIKNVDVLINNSAYNDDCDIFEKKSEQFLKTYKINAVAPFLLSKGLYEILKDKHGNIINIASTNGIDTMYPSSVDYDASKASLINITKNLSIAFAPDVRVNAVSPGWINTESTSDMEEKWRKIEEGKILLKRFAEPDEIAKVVYFIASDDASYINGSIIRVDGGIYDGN